MRITLISDNTRSLCDVAKCIKTMGHIAESVTSLHVDMNALVNGEQDLLVVFDRKQLSASEFVRRLRTEGYGVPVLVITDSASDDALISAFNAGADQVATKHANPKVWAARIRTLLRKYQAHPADRLVYEDVVMEFPTLTVTRNDQVFGLIGKPFSLLEFFMRNPDQVHDRERIGQSVWDMDYDSFSNVIDVSISKLRKVLDKPFSSPYLHTAVGRGYMFSKTPPGL